MLGAWEKGGKMNDEKGFTFHQMTGSSSVWNCIAFLAQIFVLYKRWDGS